MSHAKTDEPATTKSKVIYLVNSAICLLFMFGFGELQPIGELEKIGMQVLGIFIGLLYGWTFIGFVWTSIMGVIALGLTGYLPVSKVIMLGLGDGITTLVLFLFVFSAFMEHIGLSSAIANWFVSRKIAIGRPWVFASLLFLATYFIAGFVSHFASILLVWSIFYKVCDIVGYKRMDKYPILILIGIVYTSGLGVCIFPFRALSAMVLGSMENATGLTADFMAFTIPSIIITLLAMFGYVLFCKFILRPDVSLLTTGADHFAHLRGQKLTRDQKIGAAFLGLFIFIMVAPSIMPTHPIGIVCKQFGLGGSVLVVLGLLAIIKIDGNYLFSFQDMAKNINWDMILMFTATMPVSHAISDPEVGVMTYVVNLMKPIFNNMSGFMFIVVFLLIAGIVTQVAHNLVLAALMTPIMCSFCLEFGINPVMMAILINIALSVAIATPGGSAPGALIYLNTEWIPMGAAYKYSTLAVIISLFTLVVLGYPIAQLFF